MVDIYLGGMIEKNRRGRLALIIEESTKGLSPFLVPQDDEDYIHLTGARMAKGETRRIYQGINPLAARDAIKIAEDANPVNKVEILKLIDIRLVIPYFLQKRD